MMELCLIMSKGDYTYLEISVSVSPIGEKAGEVIVPQGKKVWSFDGVYNSVT